MDSEKYGLIGKPEVDYFVLLCAKCGVPTQNEYLGKDPTMPYFKSKCPKCGEIHQYKLTNMLWEGLPDEPAPRVGFFSEFSVE